MSASGDSDKERKDYEELKAGTGTIHTTTPNTGAQGKKKLWEIEG